MTDQELTALVRSVSERDFALPFANRATFNSRLRTTGGRFNTRTHDLDFNPRLFATCTQEQRVGIIRHELCHYHLYMRGGGFRHRDPDFKRLLQQVGGLRFAPPIAGQTRLMYLYVCQRCGRKLWRQRHVNTRRYVCGHCGGPIRLQGRVQLGQADNPRTQN